MPELRNPLAPLLDGLRARMARYIRRRQGEDVLPQTIGRRRLYILPTRGGVAFAALVTVMLVAGLNYANSLALLLTFLLAAFALVVMQQCHRNLLNVSVLALDAAPAFARSEGVLEVTLGLATGEPRPHLEAALEGAPVAGALLAPGGQLRIRVPLPPVERGIRLLPRVRISTAHPFGLVRAWTWVHARCEQVVYPAPLGQRAAPAARSEHGTTRTSAATALDEWRGLRPFRDGDSPRQVDWKAYARGAPLLVKEYEALGADERWLSFEALAPLPAERRLEQLAAWVVEAEARGERYALELPDERLPSEHGPQQRHRCLAALARFPGA